MKLNYKDKVEVDHGRSYCRKWKNRDLACRLVTINNNKKFYSTILFVANQNRILAQKIQNRAIHTSHILVLTFFLLK